MFGSKLKGMRDILTREITCIPCPGKIGQQPQTVSLLRNPRKGPREKVCYSWSKNKIFSAVVWIKWMNIFRPAYFTPRHWGVGGDIAVWAKSRVERKHLDEAGGRLRQEEIEGIQLCSRRSEYQSRQMRRSYKYADIKYALMVNVHICQVRKTFMCIKKKKHLSSLEKQLHTGVII